MKAMKFIKLAIIPASLAILMAGCTKDNEDRKVATVNGVKISESELNSALQQTYGTEVLEDLMSNELITQEAEKQKIEVTQKELDAEYETYAEYYGGEKELLSSLEDYNMTKEDILKDLKVYLYTMKLMEKNISVTDEEIKQYYEDNKDTYVTDEDEQLAFEDVADNVEADLMKERIDEQYDDWLDDLFEANDVRSYLFK